MIQKEDRWIMEEIFRLSDQALVRMINGLFGTEYQDEEKIWKEWRDQEALSVCLKVGGRVQQDIGISGKRAGRTAYQSDYAGRLLSQKTGRKWDDSFPAIFVSLYL